MAFGDSKKPPVAVRPKVFLQCQRSKVSLKCAKTVLVIVSDLVVRQRCHPANAAVDKSYDVESLGLAAAGKPDEIKLARLSKAVSESEPLTSNVITDP